jgi:hypothetical protein
MRARPRCTACDLDLEPGAERCPRCLRKSTVRSAQQAPDDTSDDPPLAPGSAGVRVALAAALLCAGVIATWALLGPQKPRPSETNAPSDPKAQLDPMNLEAVRVESSTTHETDGRTTLNVAADGGDIDRTLTKLEVAALTAMGRVKRDPGASGRVVCWLPPRLRTPENAVKVSDRRRTIETALAREHATTLDGRAVQVSFEFGELPKRAR